MMMLALILNAAGFLLLAVADPRHRDALMRRQRRLHRTSLVKGSAAALIATSLIVLMPGIDPGGALVVFFGLSTVGSALTVLAIVLRRKRQIAR